MFAVHKVQERVHIPVSSLALPEGLAQRVLEHVQAKFAGSVGDHGICVHVSSLHIDRPDKIPIARTDAQLLVPAAISLVYAQPHAGRSYAARVTGVFPDSGLLIKLCGLFDGIVPIWALQADGYSAGAHAFCAKGRAPLAVGTVMTVLCTHVVHDTTRRPYCIAHVTTD